MQRSFPNEYQTSEFSPLPDSCVESKTHQEIPGFEYEENPQLNSYLRSLFSMPDSLFTSIHDYLENGFRTFQRGLGTLRQSQTTKASTFGTWKSIPEFRDSHPVGYFLGRGIAGTLTRFFNTKTKKSEKDPASSSCSGFNVGGPYFMTAFHCSGGTSKKCYQRTIPKGKLIHTLAKFGKYGTGNHGLDNTQGKVDAESRLLDLGFTRDYAFPDLGSIDHEATKKFLRSEFNCLFHHTLNDVVGGCRDIDYYKCSPNTFMLKINGKNEKVPLLPVHIYGKLPIWHDTRRGGLPKNPTNKDVYDLSINSIFRKNNAAKDTRNQVLLSPGGKIISPIALDVRAKGLSLLAGSSGGALLHRQTNRVIGVNSRLPGGLANYQFGDEIIADTIPPFNWRLQDMNQVKIAKSTIGTEKDKKWKGDFKSGISFSKSTISVGGSGGTKKELKCSDGTAAAGIIGSGVDGHVGNFGIVCMPITTAQNYPLHVAKVLASGSVDTSWLGSSQQADFDTYLKTVLTTQKAKTRSKGEKVHQQSLTMCPPGFYLQGLTVSEKKFGRHTLIEQIIGFGL